MKTTILDTIMQHKRLEVARQKERVSMQQLKQLPLWQKERVSFKKALLQKGHGIIAEFKRKSPSKGLINSKADPAATGTAYEAAGVAAMSVLTDHDFFGGTAADLQAVRKVVHIPLLRKDFMLDEYQLHEARAWGADVVLLIAAALPADRLKTLAAEARELGLEVLLEVHNKQELDRCLCDAVDVVGINNRNLKTFEVSVQTSIELGRHIPQDVLKISESGISDPQTVHMLASQGFRGFLMGENFMKQPDPGLACQSFIAMLNAS